MSLSMQRRAARFSSREQVESLLLNARDEVLHRNPQLNIRLDPDLHWRYNLTGPEPAYVSVRPHWNLSPERLTWGDVEKILDSLRMWYAQDRYYSIPRAIAFRVDDTARDVVGLGQVRPEW